MPPTLRRRREKTGLYAPGAAGGRLLDSHVDSHIGYITQEKVDSETSETKTHDAKGR